MNEDEHEPETAQEAFARVEGELALLRRAVERMAVERAELPEQPDYSETLAGMVGAPQGLSYGQRQSEQMVNKGLSVAAKYIKFRGFVRLDELEVTGSPLVMFHP
ncbi:hypothetical protein GGR88_003018, partial [Sphingomonas jejuensis]|nr:hypothetical protein [Sphingomonas jejuensis]